MNTKTVDLTKSVNELNDVINQEEKPAPAQSLLAKAMEKMGFGKDTATPDLIKEIQDAALADVAAAAPVVEEEVVDLTKAANDLVAPTVEDVDDGTIDAGEFVEKSLAYMEGVCNLVKSLDAKITALGVTNLTLAKGINDGNYGVAALLNSQKELHKSIDSGKLTPLVVAEAVAPIVDRSELPAPSAAQKQKELDLAKGIVTEGEIDLKKERFDDGEINILAKAMRDKTITEDEYQTAQETLIIPKRLLS